jgi:signal transduction histidine kinase
VSRTDLERETVDLSLLALMVGDELARRAPDRHVAIDVDDGMTANADYRMMRVLFENLLGNAWKFTTKAASPRVDVTFSNGEYAVRDNGAGFDMANVRKLFQPFQRLHSAADFAGTGVGLATVARIVDRHGGRIWAEGVVGKGATIRFTLG